MNRQEVKAEIVKPRKIALYQSIEGGYVIPLDVAYRDHDEHYTPLPDGRHSLQGILDQGGKRMREPEIMRVAHDEDSADIALESLSSMPQERYTGHYLLVPLISEREGWDLLERIDELRKVKP